MEKTACELWLCIDSAGDYRTGTDAKSAREAYENDIQALNECEGFRLVKIVVNVPLPAVTELTGEVKEEESGKLVSAS